MSFKSRSIPLAFGVALGLLGLTACKEKKSAPEDMAPSGAALTQSFEDLKPKVKVAMDTFASLHKGMEEVPLEFPGANELRQKLSSSEEVLGVLDVEMRSFPEVIEAAKKSGNKEELAALEQRVASSAQNLAELSRRGGELVHEVSSLNAFATKAKEITEAYKHTLAGGFEVKGKANGFEQQLLQFIEDKKKVDATTWFAFDRVIFDSGNNSLDVDTSKAQLQNLIEILKAYPAVKLKIGGYTDNLGSASVNRRLSLARAEAVRHALIELGASEGRLGAEGFGSENPRCPANDTEFCREQNRRIAVRVLAK